MTLDVEKSRIANATTKPDEHEEIEVTPEMIEAGVRVYWRHARDCDAEVAVYAIFEAMIKENDRLRDYRVVDWSG